MSSNRKRILMAVCWGVAMAFAIALILQPLGTLYDRL